MGNHDAYRRIKEHARSSYVGFRLAAAALMLVVLASASTSKFGAGSPSAAPAAPTLRAASTSQNSASAAALTLAKPQGVASGDVLVAAVAARLGSGSAVSQPSGWRLIRRDDCSGPSQTVLAQAIYYKVATASEPSSYTFTFQASTGSAGSVLVYSGVDTANPVDGSSGRYSRNTVYAHAPALTPSGEGRRLVAAFAHSGAQDVTVPSDTTQRAATMVTISPTATFTAADQALASALSTGTKSARASSPQSCNLGALVLLRPNGGSSTTPPPPSPPPPSPPPPSPPPPSPPPPSPPPPSPPPPSPPPPPAPPPPSPPPPSPPPSGQVNCLVSNRGEWSLAGRNCAYGTELRFTNQQFRCDRPLSEYGPLPLKLVWNFTGRSDFGDQGHLDFLSGCRGDGNSNTIDVIVVSNADGVRFGAAGGAGKFRTSGPVDIQITGNFDCGPLGTSAAHQDTWQFHPAHAPARLDIVNGTTGNWDAGTSTCVGAGGAIFWSDTYDVDVYGGRYVTCNHGLFGAGQNRTGNEIMGAGFRTGRTDGTDPKCSGFAASDPCLATSDFRMEGVICQRWNRSTRTWYNVAPSS
jgi:hypothetical protein